MRNGGSSSISVQARGLLMVEHRLIERVIAVIRQALAQAKTADAIDPAFVDAAVDFIRTYADRTHHGKEEDILFRACDQKPLSMGDRQVMGQLVDEHGFGRHTTGALVAANERYRGGDPGAVGEVLEELRALVEFYPRHIQLEDKVFFPAARAYFTDAEDAGMVAAFYAFDRKMIHEKYRAVAEKLEDAFARRGAG